VTRVESLPHEFTGVRSPEEAQHDILVIAGAREPFNEVHLSVDRDDGEGLRTTGHLTAEARDSGPFGIFVDGVFVFEFDVRGCRGAWLSALDGADYYGLNIDLGWGCVNVSDAYNDL
jgi:hypothetical protein